MAGLIIMYKGWIAKLSLIFIKYSQNTLESIVLFHTAQWKLSFFLILFSCFCLYLHIHVDLSLILITANAA